MIPWVKYLLLVIAVVVVPGRTQAVKCPLFAKTIESHVRDFIKNDASGYLRKSYDNALSIANVSKVCHTFLYNGQFNATSLTLNFQGCVKSRPTSNTLFVRWTFFFLRIDPLRNCSREEIVKHLNTTINGTRFRRILESERCTHDTTIPVQSHQTLTCPPCKTSTTSVSPSVSRITASLSSTSATAAPNTGGLRESCSEDHAQSVTSTAAIAVASFIAGVVVVLLCLWLLHLKRAEKLCFRKSETPQEKLTSDRVTKKILAKHLSDKESLATSNVVYHVNESNKKDADDADPDYAYIDQQEVGRKSHPGNHYPIILQEGTGTKTPEIDQQLYTGIQAPGNIPAPLKDEHVYTHLSQMERQEEPRGLEDGVQTAIQASGPPSNVVERLRVADHANSDVFDRDRESTISAHDYFVLQNENFRTSHQPDVPVPDSATSVTTDATEGLPSTENPYFILEKQ